LAQELFNKAVVEFRDSPDKLASRRSSPVWTWRRATLAHRLHQREHG
jgi:hypothetical protein